MQRSLSEERVSCNAGLITGLRIFSPRLSLSQIITMNAQPGLRNWPRFNQEELMRNPLHYPLESLLGLKVRCDLAEAKDFHQRSGESWWRWLDQ
jgi:hypothetical protein